MGSPLTVAIPIFNGERFLADCLASLLKQTYTDFNLVCVDDGSVDGSVAIARSYSADPRVEVRVETGAPSLGQNWNRALAEGTTPFVVIAHQDDVYEPDFLAEMLACIENHPRAFAAHCRAVSIDESGRDTNNAAARYKDRFWPPRLDQEVERSPSDEIAILRRGNYVIAPSLIFRTEAIRSMGPFDATLQFVIDWEYLLRGLFAGYTLVGNPRRLLRFRRHPGTATRASELNLTRYAEELNLLSDLQQRLPVARRPFIALENTVLTDFATRLAGGDIPGAAALQSFAEVRIPSFAASPRNRIMKAALRAGSAGGKALKLCEEMLLRTLTAERFVRTLWKGRGK